MRLSDLVEVARAVGATSGRLDKIRLLADLLRRTPPDQIPIVVSFLSGSARQGRVGIGRSILSGLRDVSPAAEPALDLAEVDTLFERLSVTSGPGSSSARAQLLRRLFESATGDEQEFLIRLLFGEPRQGALEGVLADAVARASNVSPASVRRAAMLAGDLAPVAQAAAAGGPAALSRFALEPFQPIQPMLAESARDVTAALDALGEASFEYKLDGARIQVHRVGDEVRVFSRNLRDVTAAVPEVVTAVRAMPSRALVLDGEAIALRADGLPRPFQTTMRRFGRKLDVDRLQRELPITPFFFDALFLDGAPLVDEPLAKRVAILGEQVTEPHRVPRIVTADPSAATTFTARALASGHEGVMAKAIDGLYAAGRRGQAWLKVKRANTLDLVILAAEWGSGRRRGTLSNLHLGARDPDRGGFAMLGKTFKGLTDAMLAWQTARFLELEIGRDDYTVYIRPEVVAEIAFNEIQASSHYASGLTLRFARVKAYRPDKTAADADTIGTVRAMYESLTR